MSGSNSCNIGDEITIKFTVRNQSEGTNNTIDVLQLTDVLPAGLSYLNADLFLISGDPDQCEWNEISFNSTTSTRTLTGISIQPYAGHPDATTCIYGIKAKFTQNLSENFVNTGSLTSWGYRDWENGGYNNPGRYPFLEPITGNNISSTPWSCIDASLIIDKQLWTCPTSNPNSPEACTLAAQASLPIGTFIQYRIHITNPGPYTVFSYTITDEIPDGLDLEAGINNSNIQVMPGQPPCDISGGPNYTVNCEVPILPGESRDIIFGINQPIESTTVGEYCNTATVQ